MTGSNSAGQNELCSSSETTQETKIHWERQTFYLLTRALMGDSFMAMNEISLKSTCHKVSTLVLILVLNGCFSPRYFSIRTVDVTNNPAWWGPLARDEVLQLKQDTLLAGKMLTLHADKITDNYNSSALFGGTVSVERYKANPNGFWPELHLLAKGTRVRCVKLERFFTFEFSAYRVYAEILDGEFKGQVVGLGSFISGLPDTKGSLILNTSYLEPVQ